MNNKLYRIGIHVIPRFPVHFNGWTGKQPDPTLQKKLSDILSRQRARGGTLALSDGQTVLRKKEKRLL